MTVTNSFGRKISLEQYEKAGEMAEKFFNTREDHEQLPGSEITYEFVTKEFPLSANVIKSGEIVIGHTFILPCDKKSMEDFLEKKINERALFYRIRAERQEGIYTALYIASFLISPEFRNRGLVTNSLTKHIAAYEADFGQEMDLFSWPTTLEGRKTLESLARKLGRTIRIRSS